LSNNRATDAQPSKSSQPLLLERNGPLGAADDQRAEAAMVVTNIGGLCCNEADGTYAEEDIRNGVYWTRFELTGGEWIAVPADVVIKDPNRNGAPVAWWYFQEGKLQIRCYAPGVGV
jgi:hypothetical protein